MSQENLNDFEKTSVPVLNEELRDIRRRLSIVKTFTVGTVTTGAPGSSVIITNVGTVNNTILDFTIPGSVSEADNMKVAFVLDLMEIGGLF